MEGTEENEGTEKDEEAGKKGYPREEYGDEEETPSVLTDLLFLV